MIEVRYLDIMNVMLDVVSKKKYCEPQENRRRQREKTRVMRDRHYVGEVFSFRQNQHQRGVFAPFNISWKKPNHERQLVPGSCPSTMLKTRKISLWHP